MLSYVSYLAFSGLPVHLSWRVMFAAGAVPTVFLAAGVLTMPKSPRWLTMKGRVTEVKAVLHKTSDTAADTVQRLLEIEDIVNAGGAGAWTEVATKAGGERRRGPLAWVYSSEILPLRLRGQGAGLGTAMNRIISGVVTMTFISLYQGITMAGAFYLYAAIAAASSVFVYVCLPETRGRSLEDMEELFHTK
ncbi:unnamed protein product [Urochloa humidicola]